MFTLQSAISLPNSLKETSGLHCEKNSLLSVNDSGNDPVVYRISLEGDVLFSQRLPIDNQDWEAMTADEQYWYIGDIGNNSGRRETLSLFKVNQGAPNEITELTLTYAGVDMSEHVYFEHDYDAEALVNVQEHLFLFSKSWSTEVGLVYKINKDDKVQSVRPLAEIQGLPGVITGAAWDAHNEQFLLAGYQTSFWGMMSPFIASLSRSFEILHIQKLEGFSQVEAICIDNKQAIWLTQEGSTFKSAKLIKLVRR